MRICVSYRTVMMLDEFPCLRSGDDAGPYQIHCVLCLTESCPTLCDPVDCSPPGSSVHRILQARILEWFAISFSRGSSQPRDGTQVSDIAGGRFNLTRLLQTSRRWFMHTFLEINKPLCKMPLC